MSGHWGDVTSTMDWCELNYTVTPFVAEWWNTTSSLVILFLGLYGFFAHRTSSLGMRIAFLSMGVVGLGSVMFHGTLRFEMQLMDELPMLWCALCMFYNLAQAQVPKPRRRMFAAALCVWGTAVTLGMIATRHSFEFELFVSNFLLAEALGFAAAVPLYRRYLDSNARKWFWRGVTLHALGGMFWLIDLFFCETLLALPFYPPFHGVWHVLTGSGLYILFVCTAVFQGLANGQGARVALGTHGVPICDERTTGT